MEKTNGSQKKSIFKMISFINTSIYHGKRVNLQWISSV
jgi:hypothetical protein